MSQRRSPLFAVLLVSLLAVLGTTSHPARAVEPGEVLSDSALEARARNLSTGLRCLVCQNQSIDDSNAPLARDLRVLVRERLGAGDSDSNVIAYIVARYGDFVLLKPPLNASTVLLWIAPILLLAGLTFALVRAIGVASVTSSSSSAAQPLNEQEEAALRHLLGQPRPGP
jgi:cytochrome c-type biogenesis protein CcmH